MLHSKSSVTSSTPPFFTVLHLPNSVDEYWSKVSRHHQCMFSSWIFIYCALFHIQLRVVTANVSPIRKHLINNFHRDVIISKTKWSSTSMPYQAQGMPYPGASSLHFAQHHDSEQTSPYLKGQSLDSFRRHMDHHHIEQQMPISFPPPILIFPRCGYRRNAHKYMQTCISYCASPTSIISLHCPLRPHEFCIS